MRKLLDKATNGMSMKGDISWNKMPIKKVDKGFTIFIFMLTAFFPILYVLSSVIFKNYFMISATDISIICFLSIFPTYILVLSILKSSQYEIRGRNIWLAIYTFFSTAIIGIAAIISAAAFFWVSMFYKIKPDGIPFFILMLYLLASVLSILYLILVVADKKYKNKNHK